MKHALLIWYPRCSTCIHAKKELESLGIELTLRDIVNETPSVDELTTWFHHSGKPLKSFFNTSGNVYKQLDLKNKLTSMSEEEQLALLASNGMLIKRPLLIGDDGTIIIGKKSKEYAEYANQ